jgi:UDP-N-acetylmuramoyl-L-alanyl-D-glutamate--2,6-diaminopimelate ligase
MLLKKLLDGVSLAEGNLPIPEIDIPEIQFDSRKCKPGSMFVAINGYDQDGHKYIPAAIAAGAKTIIYQEGEAPAGITAVKVTDSRKALAVMAANFYDHPSRKINLVGITGTNGKTTTVTLLYQLFTNLGYSCGLLSTIENRIGSDHVEADHTTPDPLEINALLDEMCRRGCEYCFMEVSSQAAGQDRTYALDFRGAIFSNLTHDHLDYHKTFAEYLRCKKLFFDYLPKTAFALTNVDDKNGPVIVQNTKAEVHTYSCHTAADFQCRIIESSLEGMQLKMNGKEVWTRFIGAHNAYNLTAVYGASVLLGADPEEVLQNISRLEPVRGRMEYVKGPKDITAVVDYAHTPDALQNVLSTLRNVDPKAELVCVFGCGGDRDKTKRPEMAATVAKFADKMIVTSDNPRTEDPEAIIADIKAGVPDDAAGKTLYIIDRREAIRTALMMARQDAIVLVAGKGHEDYQIIGKVKHHFDDKEVISETFKTL